MTGPARLTGVVHVALPPAEAFRLFTPRGEEDWVDGWHPAFPAETPGDRAGTVTVDLSAAGRPGEASDVEVTYQLTALSEHSAPASREFADRYPACLQSWQDEITAWLRSPAR